MDTLEEYLKKNFAEGIIDHTIRATVNPAGETTFYIHAAGHDSETLDYKVQGNDLKLIRF